MGDNKETYQMTGLELQGLISEIVNDVTQSVFIKVMGMSPEKLLTVKEVAAKYNIAPSTIRGWINRGEITHRKKDGKIWLAVEDLNEFFEAIKVPASAAKL